MTEVNKEYYIEEIWTGVKGQRTPEEAYRRLLRIIQQAHKPLLDEAYKTFLIETGRRRTLKVVPSVEETAYGAWYYGPSDDDIFWPSYNHYLLDTKKWAEETVASIDATSTKITALLQSPAEPKITTRGLVVGYIQSGKTANFTALIAKAADAGYKGFLIFSGLTNSLRSQTQSRMEEELIGPTSDKWIRLSTVEDDFHPGPEKNVNSILSGEQPLKVIGIVKKNAVVLRRLKRWLSGASSEIRSSCPFLIVDDEADQASINSSKYDEERTAINKLLLEIMDLVPRSAYVGYTATPFANVLVDPNYPKGLYPRNFIIDLPVPDKYFGTERIFGREALFEEDDEEIQGGLNIIRRVPNDEIVLLQPKRMKEHGSFEPELAPSLIESIRYFWLATACRWARGQRNQHSTMLIHTTLYIAVHEKFKPLLQNYRKAILENLERGEDQFAQEIRRFERQWSTEWAATASEGLHDADCRFDQIASYLPEVIQESIIVVENSMAEDRLTYVDGPKIQIVIGGNTLSRGLTLEGLVVSYFVRAATAYDTLLQMGRWFGYREGYEDLPRIWMTAELEESFYDLATVEEEIRFDIRRYSEEALTPEEFGVRIRKHPVLSITSRMKMQTAITASMSYSGQRLQTLLYKLNNDQWLLSNQEAARSLLEDINQAGLHEARLNNSLLYGDVPVEYVLKFFSKYKVHESSTDFQPNIVRGYIEEQNKRGSLQKWNIVVRGKRSLSSTPQFQIMPGKEVPLLNRSRRIIGISRDDTARIGTLMTVGDRIIDLDLPADDIRGLSEHKMQKRRDREFPETGLLILYPIDKDSEPSKSNASSTQHLKLVPLNASQNLIGVGIVFPTAVNDTPQDYVTVDLSKIKREELEIELDEVDGELL